MTALQSTADVSVVGLGRVGLPLALSFADRGLRTIGIDNDPARLEAVRAGTMPFQETGAQELLDRVHRSTQPGPPSGGGLELSDGGEPGPSGGGGLELSDRVADAARARHIVITLGTPSFSHIEIDMRDIRSALDDLLGVLAPGHSLVLRSTVAPGTTEFVAGYLAKHRGFAIGDDVFVAHAPERIAAGRFLEEIDTLPCIVGGVGARSGEVVGELFAVFDAPIVQTTPVQAELAKIWTNILRYTNFALPNLLMMDCERHGANVFQTIDLINRDYPRGGIAQPGLTAGTCLRKDFAFSEERSAAPGMLLAVSRVNESVPLFLVEGIKRRLGSLANRKVAVLGLAFKADTDDERDSLAHKLIRLLERELADVATHDPHVATPTGTFEEAVEGAAAVVVAANHSEFREPRTLAAIAALAGEDCLVVDPWNCWGAGQVFAYTAELGSDAGQEVPRPRASGATDTRGRSPSPTPRTP
jgi:UDP-N-acetyl-D-mannosaminuronic acid dehydrogenase